VLWVRIEVPGCGSGFWSGLRVIVAVLSYGLGLWVRVRVVV